MSNKYYVISDCGLGPMELHLARFWADKLARDNPGRKIVLVEEVETTTSRGTPQRVLTEVK